MLISLACLFVLAITDGDAPVVREPQRASLDESLKPYLARYGLPAIAAAVVKDGEVIAAGAVGTRRLGAEIPVTLEDRFHLGSDTKAMTAMLAGMLVDEGKLRWEATVGELFPELSKEMDAGIREVKVTQLLSHTSGVPGDDAAFLKLLQEALPEDGNLDDVRYWMVKKFVKQPLAAKPGEKFAYANMNYVIVGSAIERIAGKTWEELITERIFAPLELNTAGLGPQSSLGKVDAPLGHAEFNGKITAFLAGPNGDNPLALGPAGTAHMSVLDFARWAGWHAGKGKRGPHLVAPRTLEMLQTMVFEIPARPDSPPGTPRLGRYGLGLGELNVPWSKTPLLFHGGSNGKNLAHIWIDLEHDLGIVLMTNISEEKTETALKAAAEQLYVKFSQPTP